MYPRNVKSEMAAMKAELAQLREQLAAKNEGRNVGRQGEMSTWRRCAHCGSNRHQSHTCYYKPPPKAANNCGICFSSKHTNAECKAPCRNCDKPGHATKFCPEERRCNRCQRTGHISINCPQNGNNPSINLGLNNVIKDKRKTYEALAVTNSGRKLRKENDVGPSDDGDLKWADLKDKDPLHIDFDVHDDSVAQIEQLASYGWKNSVDEAVASLLAIQTDCKMLNEKLGLTSEKLRNVLVTFEDQQPNAVSTEQCESSDDVVRTSSFKNEPHREPSSENDTDDDT